VFGLLRRLFEFILGFARTYPQKDAIMAYYAPIGLMLLVPTWYILISLGFAAMYWSLGVGDWLTIFRLSGSSLFTLGFATAEGMLINAIVFTEAMIGLILVALLISYLPTMYAAFSRREQAVSMLEVRAGTPPSALEMLLRFNRIHGLDKLSDYWRSWEIWFADVEESHTTLPALTFFRSPRADTSWVTGAGTVLDAASLTLSSIDIPFQASAVLAVMSPFPGAIAPRAPESVAVEALVDDAPIAAGHFGKDLFHRQGSTWVQVDVPRLYDVAVELGPGLHELRLRGATPGWTLYAFSFQACREPLLAARSVAC